MKIDIKIAYTVTLLGGLVFSFGMRSLHAQTAKVIALSPEDAKMAQQLDEEQKALTKRANDFHERVRMKYIGGAPDGTFGTVCLYTPCSLPKHTYPDPKPGWENGFEFSDDWKYIVPITIQPYKLQSPAFGCNTLTVTPAVGIFN